MNKCTCPQDGTHYCTQCLHTAHLWTPPRPHVLSWTHDGSEAAMQSKLRSYSRSLGYLYYHTHSSKRSDPGWPDTAIVHPDGGSLFLWELKRQDQSAQPSGHQRQWLGALARVTRVHAALYRPSDWEEMLRHLQASD